MDPATLRLLGLVAAVLVSIVLALALRRRSGGRGARPDRLTARDLGHPLGARATLVQFSAPSCAICPRVSRALTEFTRDRDDVRHIEVDAGQRLALTRRLGVHRTPTVLVLDRTGLALQRFSGPPDLRRLRAVVSEITEPGSVPQPGGS